MRMEIIKKLAYEKYQLDWMMKHGYSVYDIMKSLSKYMEDTGESLIESYWKWEADSGFDGSLWVCFDEFVEWEFQNRDYMKSILSHAEYLRYCEEMNIEEDDEIISMGKYINKKMIEDGLMSKIIVPELTDGGLICRIGECWFYFGGSEFDDTDPNDIAFTTKVEEIKMTLDAFYEDACKGGECYRDEYLYYYYYLCENI